MSAVGADALLDLEGELAGGRQDQGPDGPAAMAWVPVRPPQTLEHRQDECRRLACAGLSAGHEVAAVDDDVYKVAVTGQRAVETFGGARPGDGEKFLVLDVNVQNVGKDGELFQTKEQLKCATADGQQREIAPATYQGVYRPTELVFIPPGERRSFQVAYAIPATETKPRLAYGGVSLAKVLDLVG